ncbi:hypothetical protein PFISCL1PPCAC_24968, partial [Pristionchus fissidentatus]
FLNGTSIKCDEKTGFWDVGFTDGTNAKVKGGGQVICAKSNPNPAPQMTLGTTIAAPNVCEVCIRANLGLLECNECSDLSTDFEYSISADKKRCIAKSLQYDGQFQTNKGLIKGPLSCNKTDAKWTYKKGSKYIEVNKFAAYKKIIGK